MRKTITFNNYDNCLRIELNKAKGEFGLSLLFNSSNERTISFGISLPYLFKFYVTLDSLYVSRLSWWKKLIQPEYANRYNHILINKDLDSVDGGYNIFLAFWSTVDSSDGGFSKLINTNNLIFGEFKLKKSIINEFNEKVFVPAGGLYEGDYYDLKIKEIFYDYKWQRFNRKLSGSRYEIECESGVPHREKFGMQDRCYSLTLPMNSCGSKNEAIQEFIKDIQNTRLRV